MQLSLASQNGQTAREEGLDQSPLAIRGLTVSYGEKPAVFSVDMTVVPGQMTAIIGPNGAGKSTLLKAALGIVPPVSGRVQVFGRPLDHQRARIAYVPTRLGRLDLPTRVTDVVMMGLYRELGLLGRIRGTHHKIAQDRLERVGMSEFAERQIGQLSGGQQQRVFRAALAQGRISTCWMNRLQAWMQQQKRPLLACSRP